VNLNEYVKNAYDLEKAKGFNPDSGERNLGEQLMLIVTELGEMLGERVKHAGYEPSARRRVAANARCGVVGGRGLASPQAQRGGLECLMRTSGCSS
jgi:hypothetical protein